MAISRILVPLVMLVAILVALHPAKAEKMQWSLENEYHSPLPKKTIDCGLACSVRCKLSSRPNLCKRACGSCCSKCRCVPPGTAGNYEACPCYAGLTTRNFIRKCP